MSKVKLQFWRTDYSETINDADEFEVSMFDERDLQWAAEQYAEYYHDNRDGWECSWPIDFHVGKEGKFLGVVSVDREARPHFYGKLIEPKERK